MKQHEKGTTVTGFDITDVKGLDRITVYYENFEKGQGIITIVCYGKSWTSFWGSMGTDILDFFTSCDEHYLAKNLSSIEASIVDYELISDKVGEEVNEQTVWVHSEDLENIYGTEWFLNGLPTIRNPDYEYLCKIIKTVQECIRKFNPTTQVK